MQRYKEIHIWDFPPMKTHIRLKRKFRYKLFNKLLCKVGSTRKIADKIHLIAKEYRVNRNCKTGWLYCWKRGLKKSGGKLKKLNIPLWILIEFSKMLSDKKIANNRVMREIEKNIQYYASTGNSHSIKNSKFPLYLTPEMFSIIFHFMGDGHISNRPECTSSYRQMNEQGLNNFLKKLTNVFGKFGYSEGEYADGRLNVPKIFTYFYNYYFILPNTDTFEAYVPRHLKNFPIKFLLAGLAAFIVDEGNICDVITVYSKNKRLIDGIREIGLKCGYICHPVREKYARGKFDSYRFNISVYSFPKLYDDLKKLSSEFPTCDLAQKQAKFISKIH